MMLKEVTGLRIHIAIVSEDTYIRMEAMESVVAF